MLGQCESGGIVGQCESDRSGRVMGGKGKLRVKELLGIPRTRGMFG